MDRIRYKVNGNIVQEIHKLVVHRFDVADVDDPNIHAAGPLFDWEQSEAGQFVMKNAEDRPEWQRHMDPMFMGYRYVVIAELEKKKLSEFYLRFGKINV